MFRSKIYNLVFTFLACLTIGFGTSCSNGFDFSDNFDIDSPEALEATLSLLSKNWGSSKSTVKAEQHKELVLIYEDSEFMKYSNSNGSFFVSYSFKDDQLATSLLLLPTDKMTAVANYKLDDYEYIGNMDGAAVHTSETAIASVMNCDFDDNKYVAIGLTPADDSYDLFATINPISVTTCAATDITTSSMSLNGSFTGETVNPVAYIKYSYSADMSSATIKKCTITDKSFSYSLNGIKPNTTIYFYAYIVDEEITYEGNIESASVETMKTYAIGDIYPSSDNPEGVVCKISNSGASGSILSLDQAYLQWDINGIVNTDYSAYYSYDGKKNDIGTTSPYAKWIKGHGSGWYGPARYQLIFSKADLKLINTSLRSLNATIMNGFYWSSTQYSGNHAYVVTVTEGEYMGYDNQNTFYNSKDQNRSVRAMKDF